MNQNGGISHAEEAFFWTDLIPDAPVGFALASPENNVAGLSDMPIFLWEHAEDPDPMDYAIYTLQIATDSSFSELVFETHTNADVEYEMTEAISSDTEYWWKVIATDTDSLSTGSEIFKFTVGYVSIADMVELPTEYVLQQNFPNPFNPITTIQYELPIRSDVQITIYDLLGRKVTTLLSETQDAGYKSVVWNATNDRGKPVSAGVYLYQIQAGEFMEIKKMLLLK